jgi:hypothetical protein
MNSSGMNIVLKQYNNLDPDSVRIQILYGCEKLQTKFEEEDMKTTNPEEISKKYKSIGLGYLTDRCNLILAGTEFDEEVLKILINLKPKYISLLKKDTIPKTVIPLLKNYQVVKNIGLMCVMQLVTAQRGG